MRIENVFRALEQEHVKYAVIGGIAVVLYGYVRFTRDIDLMIDFSRANVAKFGRAMKRLRFRPGPPINIDDLALIKKRIEWIREKNAEVITFYDPDFQMLQIDVLLTKKLSETKVVKKKIDDVRISVVDYDELIEMKKQSGRPLDLIDVEKLEVLRKK